MFIRPLAQLTAADLDSAGGKAANLGELMRAGLRVPDGFVLTTDAYRLAADAAGVDPDDPRGAAERLRGAPVPEPIAAAACEAYADLGAPAVAVRSSATAEDLPGASFAGQQDTYLNVSGEAELLNAIRQCWASLWNDRAVAYRHANAIEPASVSLAVVVQAMVPATAAGVLFTADPMSGQRHRASIDAIPELGERLVSGQANPDHYVVDTTRQTVLQQKAVAATPVLTRAELQELARLGERVERHFGSPQDIEFALDGSRDVWLVQSRPITTLYPLPENLPANSGRVRVYFSANVFQGYFEPLTPMGIQFFQLLGTGVYRGFGASIADAVDGPPGLVSAGQRLFVDLTDVLRDRFGRRVLTSVLSAGEARSSVVFGRLAADPRIGTSRTPRIASVRRLAAAIVRVGVPRAALRVILRPAATRARYAREMQAITRVDVPPGADASAHLDAFERLLLETMPRFVTLVFGMMVPAMLSLALAHWLLRGVARPGEVQTLTRSAPYNPTTKMNLALWALSVELRADGASREALLRREPGELATAYRSGELPNRLQAGLQQFLERYGFRSIGEIDIGVRRWSEDPTHILGALANYLRLEDQSLAPDALFARGEREANTMLEELVGRLNGPRRLLTRLLLRRMRLLVGAREAPKFYIIRLVATPARQLLLSAGQQLAEQDRLGAPEDIFFLSLPEARRAAAGADVRGLVAERRQAFDRERARHHLPRVLLSDGTDAEVALVDDGPSDDTGLRGSPASPGIARGVARVIQSPLGARLEPGEILVAPSTDPGWTPLFLTAGGLVMEMGGMMSHGAVVAREYGIPAVVGVARATERITSGQRLTVDGSAGRVTLEA